MPISYSLNFLNQEKNICVFSGSAWSLSNNKNKNRNKNKNNLMHLNKKKNNGTT